MLLIEKIKPLYFLIAICFGFFMTYVFTPMPKVIYKYPTPDTADQLTYMDGANHCFKYQAKEVKCPKKKSDIHQIPVQKHHESDSD